MIIVLSTIMCLFCWCFDLKRTLYALHCIFLASTGRSFLAYYIYMNSLTSSTYSNWYPHITTRVLCREGTIIFKFRCCMSWEFVNTKFCLGSFVFSHPLYRTFWYSKATFNTDNLWSLFCMLYVCCL